MSIKTFTYKQQIESNGVPVLAYEYTNKILFGLFSIEYYIENKRPDLEKRNAQLKHSIRVKILWKEFKWAFRGNYLSSSQFSEFRTKEWEL